MKYRERDVVIVYHGDITAHRPGCRDIARQVERSHGTWWEATVRDFHDLVLAIYGPNCGSFFHECGNTMLDWAQYGEGIHVAPCVGQLTYDITTITADDRAARWGDDRGEGPYGRPL